MKKMSVSPSAITTFERCPRKWFFGSQWKLPDPKGPAAQRGSDIHEYLSRFYHARKVQDEVRGVPDQDLIARLVGPALERVPAYSREILCESWTGIDSGHGLPRGVRFTGKLDLCYPADDPVIRDYLRQVFRENQEALSAVEKGVPVVHDWKSKGTRRNLSSPEDLARDHQLGSYAYWALEQPFFRRHQSAFLVHVYVGSNADAEPWIETSVAFVSRRDLSGIWQESLPVIQEMGACRSKALVDVPRHFAACSDWGGCPYSDVCFNQKTDEGKMTAEEAQQILGGARNPGPATPVAATPVAATPVAATPGPYSGGGVNFPAPRRGVQAVPGPPAPQTPPVLPVPQGPQAPPARKSRRWRAPPTPQHPQGELITPQERERLYTKVNGGWVLKQGATPQPLGSLPDDLVSASVGSLDSGLNEAVAPHAPSPPGSAATERGDEATPTQLRAPGLPRLQPPPTRILLVGCVPLFQGVSVCNFDLWVAERFRAHEAETGQSAHGQSVPYQRAFLMDYLVREEGWPKVGTSGHAEFVVVDAIAHGWALPLLTGACDGRVFRKVT